MDAKRALRRNVRKQATDIRTKSRATTSNASSPVTETETTRAFTNILMAALALILLFSVLFIVFVELNTQGNNVLHAHSSVPGLVRLGTPSQCYVGNGSSTTHDGPRILHLQRHRSYVLLASASGYTLDIVQSDPTQGELFPSTFEAQTDAQTDPDEGLVGSSSSAPRSSTTHAAAERVRDALVALVPDGTSRAMEHRLKDSLVKDDTRSGDAWTFTPTRFLPSHFYLVFSDDDDSTPPCILDVYLTY